MWKVKKYIIKKRLRKIKRNPCKFLSKQKWKIFLIFFVFILIGTAMLFSPLNLDESEIERVKAETTSKPKTTTSSSKSSSGSSIQKTKPPELVTLEQLSSYLEKRDLVKELPEKAILNLRLYNFNTGYREWEISYTITKGNAEIGYNDESDLDIIIHSKYLQDLAKSGICSTVKKAKKNGDFAADVKIGTTLFMWKYKSMMEYKDCFGV